jgi:hypothetical protein
MSYVCVHRPDCLHAPHRTIPKGEEEWVLLGDGLRESHHKDCIVGLHYVARDGKKASPYFVNENLASQWLLRRQGQSVDYATRWGGYSFEVVTELPKILRHDRKSEPDTLLVFARQTKTILRVGRFLPGGEGRYASAYVLRYVGGTEPYVTHCASVMDDTEDGKLSVFYHAGHYFSSYEKAVADLAERGAE